jgi:3-deoxy-manno-octulosonate cytidylyltransferase (CMP-KDO synthetase)
MAVAIVLPARLASTRLPNKLLLDRTGRTLLEHTIAQALAARKAHPNLVRTVLVACDDAKLLEIAQRAGAQAVITRPDHQSGTERIAEAAASLKEEIIVNLQADEPEMTPESLHQVATLLTEGPNGIPMATLATPIFDEEKWRKPNVVKVVVSADGLALYFSRSPIPFPREEKETAAAWSIDGRRVYGLHHLGLYAYRREFLLRIPSLPLSRLEKLEKLEQLRVLEAGHGIRVGIAAAHPPGIDTPEEYEQFVARWKAKT